MVLTLSSSRYAARPDSLAMMISSTGHLAGLSSMDSSSACLSAGINRMCPLGMRMSVDIFVWPRIAFDVHGESSHTGRTMTTRNGVSVCSEEARAWRTACSISSGSYSGFAIQDEVQRYLNELWIAPKLTSSEKAEQYVSPSVIGQLRGLPKSSVVVRNVLSIAPRRAGGMAQWFVSFS
jgi:hypothetical protein